MRPHSCGLFYGIDKYHIYECIFEEQNKKWLCINYTARVQLKMEFQIFILPIELLANHFLVRRNSEEVREN